MTHADITNFSALESLLRIMRNNDDFPALSNTISEINNAVASEHSSTHSLTKVILQDFSLTNKLLKIVNTVSYGQFGGKISTISKAVVILGFDVVRDVATTLVLIDFLQNKSQSAELTDQVLSAFFVGLVARQLTFNLSARNHEEAMICGIFHNLGQLLTVFYFFEESQKINQMISEGVAPEAASYAVLGISYNDLGLGVAKTWSFPPRLLHGMQALPSRSVKPHSNELDQLNVTVNLAGELTATASSHSAGDKSKVIQQLTNKYKSAIQVDEKMLQNTLEQVLDEMAVRAGILNIGTKKSPLFKRISNYTSLNINDKNQRANVDQHDQTNVETSKDSDHEETSGLLAQEEVIDSETILQAGIQDVINTLVSEYNLNDILQMILETMYRGLGCNRVVMFVRDEKNNVMQARSGYGKDVERLLPEFKFPLSFTPDVFHLCIDKGADIVIENADVEPMASKIPQWYKSTSKAKSFLLLPVMINKKAVGCFYADMLTTNAFDETSKSLSLLRTLRNQAVLAIKQKHA